ncbi:MAG: phosphatidylcholine/phosphatidylserine synthase [Phycisphaerae bacterium]|nr:phosphatidylcholine/phosphatidylserine synthase [Phycisphaerae bacterium]
MTPEERARRRERLAEATVPLRKLVPNLFTTAAMCSGLASLHYTTKEEWSKAVAAIGMAAILDALDGRAARLLKAQTRFGEHFDSYADFVAFGVAPAFLIYRWCRPDMVFWGVKLEGTLLVAVVLFGLCSALRLARFTASQAKKKPGSKPSEFFTGMPTPAAAGAALIPAMLWLSDLGVRVPTVVVIGWMVLIAALMVSRLPMFSFKRLRVKRTWVMPLMLAMGLVVGGFVRDAWLTASAICMAYMLSLGLSMRVARRGALPEAAQDGAGGGAVGGGGTGTGPVQG